MRDLPWTLVRFVAMDLGVEDLRPSWSGVIAFVCYFLMVGSVLLSLAFAR